MTGSKKPTPKPTPDELWRSLEEQADADEMDRILALSPASLDRELAAAGVDPLAARAQGEAIARHAQMADPSIPPAPPLPAGMRVPGEPRAGRRVKWAAVVPLAMAAAVLPVLFAAGVFHDFFDNGAGQGNPRWARDHAALERKAAFDACAAARWDACVTHLDAAKSLDPAGDTDPRVQDARAAAKARATPR